MSSITYRKEIDGLRALAVIPVVLFHAGFDWFRGGFVGVDIFFVISGYLISSIIIAEKNKGTFSLASFYERRARRILPALLTVMVVSLLFSIVWMLPGELIDFAKSAVAASAFVSNIFFWQEGGYFATATALKPLFHTWSLAVEEQYYIIFPVMIVALWPLGKRWVVCIITLIALVSLALCEWKSWDYSLAQANFYLITTRAWELMIGALCAFYLTHKKERTGNQWLSLAGIGLILYAIITFDEHMPFPSLYTLIPTIGTVCIILFTTDRTIIYRLLSLPVCVGIGLMSYSLYLWHQPLFAFARLNGIFDVRAIIGLIALSVALGWISWRYIERPFRDRERVSFKRFLIPVTAILAIIITSSMVIITNEGFVTRYAAHDQNLARVMTWKQQQDYRNRYLPPLKSKEFSNDGRIKTLVIGDSYSKDLVMSLYESGIADSMDISMHKVSRLCGNLFLHRDFSDNIPPKHRVKCQKDGWYNDEKLLMRIKQAEVIFLASKWSVSAWQIALLPESLANIKQISNAQVIILGEKEFSSWSNRDLIQMPREVRSNLTYVFPPHLMEQNKTMHEILDKGVYIDVQPLFCPKDNHCPFFTQNMERISYDGNHLTQDGMKFFGDKLLMHPVMQHVLKMEHNATKETTAHSY